MLLNQDQGSDENEDDCKGFIELTAGNQDSQCGNVTSEYLKSDKIQSLIVLKNITRQLNISYLITWETTKIWKSL